MSLNGKLAVRIATDAGFKVILTENVKDAYESMSYTLRVMKHDDGRRLVIETSPGDFRLRQARAYALPSWKTRRREANDLDALKEMLHG